jgi:hypothetical protein
MNEENIETKQELARVASQPVARVELENHKPADAKTLRIEHVGALLAEAYKGASKLKMSKDELKELIADFPDEVVELRPHDGIIYIPHMILRERLWAVFGPNQVAEICRERSIRNDTSEIAVDLVLLIRGIAVAEAIGTAKYYSKNPNANFGDCVESAWSDALRRCCKRFGVGTQVWRPQYIRAWQEKNAEKMAKSRGKGRSYTMRENSFQKAKREMKPESGEPSQDLGYDPDWPEAERTDQK